MALGDDAIFNFLLSLFRQERLGRMNVCVCVWVCVCVRVRPSNLIIGMRWLLFAFCLYWVNVSYIVCNRKNSRSLNTCTNTHKRKTFFRQQFRFCPLLLRSIISMTEISMFLIFSPCPLISECLNVAYKKSIKVTSLDHARQTQWT